MPVIVVAQDEWSSKPGVAQDRFYCTSSGVSTVGLRGVSKSHKCKGLVKVGASKGVMRVDLNKIMAGGGGVPGNHKTPLDTPLPSLLHKGQ